MTFANFSSRLKLSGATLVFVAIASLSLPASAQEAEQGYKPPPMFDMTPPMVRPEAPTGNLVEPMSSKNVTLDETPLQRPAAVSSSIGNRTAPAVQKPTTANTTTVTTSDDLPPLPAPTVEKTAPTDAPIITTRTIESTTPTTTTTSVPEMPVTPATPAPVLAKKMEPIIDERDVAREKKDKATKSVNGKTEKAPRPNSSVHSKATVAPVPAKPEPKIEGSKTETAPKTVKPETVAPPAVPASPEAVVAPVAPAKQDGPIAAPISEKTDAPTTAAKPAADERTQPVKGPEKEYESAIKGPKTMPSIPMQDVDTQATFKDADKPAANAPTIMERTQAQAEEKTAAAQIPVAVAPPPGVVPSDFQTGERGTLTKELTLPPGQVGLDEALGQSVAAGVYTELSKEGREDWRVQIRSYATPFGEGLSTDRRISLARALSLRTRLIENGVPANRIDILAEGLDSGDAKPGDRIDLEIFGPST